MKPKHVVISIPSTESLRIPEICDDESYKGYDLAAMSDNSHIIRLVFRLHPRFNY